MLILSGLEDWGLLILRIFIGIIFLVHGWGKLSGKNTPGGFRFLGFCESIGGLAAILGLLTQFASIGFSLIMLGAIYMKISKWNVRFTFPDKPGWEFDFMVLGAAIALILLGAGNFSLDAYFGFFP